MTANPALNGTRRHAARHCPALQRPAGQLDALGVSMTKACQALEGEHAVRPKHSSTGANAAEIRHLRLFASANVRYEIDAKAITLVYEPQQQAGPNRALLERLVALRDGDLPSVHPGLPRAVGSALLEAGVCSEPMVVCLHTEVC